MTFFRILWVRTVCNENEYCYFHVFGVAVTEYRLAVGALLMCCGWWGAQHFTHTALNLQHSPWGGRWLLHFMVKFLLSICPHPALPQCQAVRLSGLWGRGPSSPQAFAVSPVQRWQPGDLTLLRQAGAPLRGLLRLAGPPCLLSQMPSPSVTLLFQMGPHPLLRAGLSADLDCPPLPWVLAKPNARSPMPDAQCPMPVWLVSLLLGSRSGAQSSRLTSRGSSSGSHPEV